MVLEDLIVSVLTDCLARWRTEARSKVWGLLADVEEMLRRRIVG